jgi:hypothetical protein
VTLGAVVVLVAGGLYLESRSPRPGDTNRQGDNPTLDARSSPSPPDLVVQDLSFTDATHGWALGTTCQTVAGSQSCALALQATTDAGSTWNLVTAPPTKWSNVAARGPEAEGVRFIRFAGERDGWVFGPDLFATRDGGQTWAAESAFGEVVALEAVGDSVWLIERRCMPEPCRLSLHASADMGGTWQEQDVPIAGPESSLVRAGRSHTWILSTDREDGAPATGLVATSNGGASWASLPDPCTESAYLAEADLSAVDASNLWLVCAGEAAARDLDDLLPLELADDALIDALYRDILPPGSGEVRDGGVIVTLGAIVPADDGLHVTAGASCASLCPWGTTYVVARVDGRWRVTGTTGSMWIA